RVAEARDPQDALARHGRHVAVLAQALRVRAHEELPRHIGGVVLPGDDVDRDAALLPPAEVGVVLVPAVLGRRLRASILDAESRFGEPEERAHDERDEHEPLSYPGALSHGGPL